METRGADVACPGRNRLVGQQFLEASQHDTLARGVLSAGQPERLEGITDQTQRAGVTHIEFGQLQAARAEIDTEE